MVSSTAGEDSKTATLVEAAVVVVGAADLALRVDRLMATPSFSHSSSPKSSNSRAAITQSRLLPDWMPADEDVAVAAVPREVVVVLLEEAAVELVPNTNNNKLPRVSIPRRLLVMVLDSSEVAFLVVEWVLISIKLRRLRAVPR